METPKTLGKLVATDRQLLGLTRGELIEMLQSDHDPPRNETTKKPYRFHLSWLMKLENGYMKRSLPLPVRRWLADQLKGDRALYERLPMTESDAEPAETADDVSDSDVDALPLIKHLATKAKITALSLRELKQICEVYQHCEQLGVSFLDHWKFN
jgi:hypothetical protein